MLTMPVDYIHKYQNFERRSTERQGGGSEDDGCLGVGEKKGGGRERS